MAVLPALLELGVAEFDALAAALGELAQVWAEFQRALSRVPVIRRIEDGTATLGDYRQLLLNLRQQVVDGGRWISLAAAHFSADWFWLRSAAIEHDLNVYRVLSALGGVPEAARAPDGLDCGMLDIPPVDPEAWRRRLLNLDIQTALCLMNVPFALCLTPDEYRRAVHSLRLDASLLTVLASVTGDDTFLSWRTGLPPVRVDSNVDVPSMVYEHAVLCEYAHARLRQLYVLCQGASAGAGCS
jgi:hypothetical protein